MIFKNGRLIFPNGVRDGLDLLVEDACLRRTHRDGKFLAPQLRIASRNGARGRAAARDAEK